MSSHENTYTAVPSYNYVISNLTFPKFCVCIVLEKGRAARAGSSVRRPKTPMLHPFVDGKDDLDKSRDQTRTLGNNAQIGIIGGTSDLTDWGNTGISGKWSRQWSPRFYSNALVAYSEYFSDYFRFTDQEVRNVEADTLIRASAQGTFEDNRGQSQQN